MSEEQKRLLETQLWNIANILRGKINANQFQDYILGFIFYKYLSEKMEKHADKILVPDNIKYADVDESTKTGKEYLEHIKDDSIHSLGFFLKPSDLFRSLAAKGNSSSNVTLSLSKGEPMLRQAQHDTAAEPNDSYSEETFILEDLARILRNIEKSTMGSESEEDFDDLFSDIDLDSNKIGRTVGDRNKVIVKIITALNAIDFDLDNVESDMLGDAYEYLIGQFAAGAGQKAGEFYTPQAVSSILAKIVTTGKHRLKSVYDPTCGSGSLLLRVAKEVDEVAHFYGQEQNRTTYNLARMNMILHDVSYHDFDIRHEDTLERPKHIDLKFEAIVANPPFSAQWSANPLMMNDERFSQYGRLAPKTKADFAFIQHMVHQLDDNGIMACIAPHGVLFRGAAEGHIRKYLIADRNYVDAIIGLPANVFYGTSIPTCILVLKKCRENPDDILFIDASKEFEKVKNQNVLRAEHIDKIANTYTARVAIDKFSALAPLEAVKANDYNLNIPRYVNTFEEAESIDINAVCALLNTQSISSIETDNKLRKLCIELDIPFPNGSNLPLLNLYKKGMMQKIFNQEIRFKDENGNDFGTWEAKTLNETSRIVSGLSIDQNEQQSGYAVTRIETISDGTIDIKKLGYINTDKNISEYKLCEGDILFSNINSVSHIGKTAFVAKDMDVYHGMNLLRLKVFIGVEPKFLYYFLNRTVIREYMKSICNQAVSQASINQTALGKTKLSLPSLKEQTKIANFLSAIDDKINLVAVQIEKMENWKKGCWGRCLCNDNIEAYGNRRHKDRKY